ncbi:hypothetical protein MMC13_000154 [Lambiella insularis]|nr:hypothetical protein [Lambiella insularis]
MLRFRRYRVFLVLAVFTLALLYHYTSYGNVYEAKTASLNGFKKYGAKGSTTTEALLAQVTPLATQARVSAQAPAQEPVLSSTEASAAPMSSSARNIALHSQTSAIQTSVPSASSLLPELLSSTTHADVLVKPTAIVTSTAAVKATSPGEKNEKLAQGGQGRKEPPPPLKSVSAIHWARMPDHFPIPSESIIPIPTGRPSAIPKIQHTFGDESSSARAGRERKLAAVKEAFQHSWTSYKRPESWLQDELSPVSGKARNPFCGWAATLVDTLDTLWIMGMEEEFQQATLAVGEIDFTTSIRADIPLFETTIRYLGGLLSAYDLSEGKYKVLLTKAVELGDVLMGAFDTPNRMPISYYLWKPTFASRPHRAMTRVVLAELGSLSMEFTRLAQVTKEPKYYDAVARITNELEIWQNNTKVPGLWPRIIDASGCRKPDYGSGAQLQHSLNNGPNAMPNEVLAESPLHAVPPVAKPSTEVSHVSSTAPTSPIILDTQVSSTKISSPSSPSAQEPDSTSNLKKRQLTMESLTNTVTGAENDETQNGAPSFQLDNATSEHDETAIVRVDCEAQGLASPPGSWTEEFTVGAMADSVYEYLPKQYMLLGGLVPQYKMMYELASNAMSKHLLFRPMIPGDQSTLILGTVIATEEDHHSVNMRLNPEQEHLLCFAGGMYAIGAKIFNREADLDIAAKLTDGCVWSYGATATGIMPEISKMMACESKDDCKWNQTRWYEELDPYRNVREQTHNVAQKAIQGNQNAVQHLETSTPSATGITSSIPSAQSTKPVVENEILATTGPLAKRQLGHIDNTLPDSVLKVSTPPDTELSASPGLQEDLKNQATRVMTVGDSLAVPPVVPGGYPTHEEYVQNRIRDERIPTGMTDIVSSKYILRPEAIESVFIMYRVTGDEKWREKGWKMFNSVQNHTRVEFGYSGIRDVTNETPNYMDEMESFWMAETLKYYYLLFSTPDLISLDDYVLNTEAHPFKRPR